ncbi:TRAP transporter large permease subunit [Rhodobacteraceae bacterium N5(2021)]|uniref:TRAP transporter large permease subunit n=1 Tax=Gymnodinialimonas phycosphaerae TaxID=2841589 RepID=A0A975TW36_9RHOB|nr:TRAP transporter large permease subunit [Gymnodinialimonas phycosphaerae]MBY4891702.1 TRAP transporter large permease subunit [Gymnodinialimonas phycosphaerae]
MLFGLDGVEIGLIIVFLTLFGGIMTGFPVAFAIGGAGVISFAIIAALDSSGLLIHQAVDVRSDDYMALIADGIPRETISTFRYPDLPRIDEALFPGGWETALDRNLSFIVNRMNERVIAGQSIEILLAVLMFVMMGITLERSKIANDLLTTMARVFGPLPGGLAVSIVIVGAFLAASTGIVGATVVTMGLLALPTMLRNNYSPELATGVIAASGTLGQIIPPSIVIVLLGTLAGDLYATGQETRAVAAGCRDALTYLGEPAVLSVGTLFQAALLPGIFLAFLYGAYSFGYALVFPSSAPAVQMGKGTGEPVTRAEGLTWFLGVPVAIIAAVVIGASAGLIGGQTISVSNMSDSAETSALRTNVSEQCAAGMIELHGQEAWDAAVAEQAAIVASGGDEAAHERSEEEMAVATQAALDATAPIGSGVAAMFTILALVLVLARGISPSSSLAPLLVGGLGVVLAFIVDIAFIHPLMGPGATFMILAIPFFLTAYGCYHAVARLAQNELLRVVFPPLVLIIAVLGSILGGITNPTPAAALGAAGAIMLAAYRKFGDDRRGAKIVIAAAFAVVIMIIVGVNFDLRMGREAVTFADWIAYIVTQGAYHFAFFGLLFACWTLLRTSVLGPVVRETAKVTSMVFTILIGSQVLNLTLIAFGGEHYIQQFLRSFDQEWAVFLLVMAILFVLGFVLDFLEIIYIVIPIVGPVIYGGTLDPKWVTIMIAVNLQTSFLTPPFGFALFYLRGVAPKSVTTGHIYRGVLPFVGIQVVGLAILWFFPGIVTIVPDLLPN